MRKFVVAAGVLAFLTIACGGSDDSSTADVAGGDVVDDAAEVAVEAAEAEAPCTGGKLAFADPIDDFGKATADATAFNLSLGYNAKRDLKVKYTRCGQAVSGATVTYAVVGTTDLADLASGTAVTDADGLASTSVTEVKQKIGVFQVKVCVDGDPSVSCVIFNDSVMCKCGGAPLTVGIAEYKGAYPMMDTAEVRLFKQNPVPKPVCADFSPETIEAQQATVTSAKFAIDSSSPFLSLPGLDVDKTQKYTIVVLARKGDGPLQAWGCNDTDGKVEDGAVRYVEVPLQDLPLQAAGAYDVTTTMDLATGLPTEADARLTLATKFLADPVGETLLLTCRAGGTTGTMHDFCVLLFATPQKPDTSSMTAIGLDVQAILAANAPAKLPTVEDARAAFAKAQLVDKLTLAAAFDKTGTCAGADGCNEEWTLAGAGIGSANVPKIPIGKIAADVEAQRSGATGLMLKSHKVGIGWGLLVDQLFEHVLLQAVFGSDAPQIADLTAAMEAVLGGRACLSDGSCCAKFSAAAFKASSMPATMFDDACKAMVGDGAAWLRNQWVSLDPAGGSLQIGSVDPCGMADSTGDMKVDALGSTATPCTAEAVFDVGSESFQPKTTFQGTVSVL